MKIQKIAPADILMDKPDDEYRSFSKEFCLNLAKSIESEGLMQEPCVREIPDKPGKYRPVYGRNRIYACGKVLKWEEIPCKVASASMGDEEAVAMEDAENLWRNPLSDAQLKKALIRWQRAYDARHPAAAGTGAAQKQKAIVKERLAEAEARSQEVDEVAVASEVAAENKPFAKVLAETLKISASTAARLARITKHLEPEQVDVLDKHKVTDHTALRLAGLGDKESIAKAINLIASGMDHAEAVRQAGKARQEAKEAGAKGKAGNGALPAPRKKELTDDEWLEEHCGHLLKQLRRKAAFKRDAILYRRISEAVARFRTAVKKPTLELKGDKDSTGPFYGAIIRAVRARHPSEWYTCHACNTTGTEKVAGPDGKEVSKKCSNCYGSGYKLSFDTE